MKLSRTAAACLAVLAALAAASARADAPQYTIIDLGVVGTNASASQAFGISPDGSTVVGRALGTQYLAYAWNAGSGMTALPNLSGRNYAVANAVNNAGTVVGTSATTAFGSSPLPVLWSGGAVSALPLPGTQTVGQANSINASGLIAGAAGSGIGQRGVIYTTSSATVISATLANGSYFQAAFGINDAGLVVGNGIDPNNAAVNVGLVYDSASNTMTSVGALPGLNGALAFGVSNSGYVVGSSMLNQGSGTPYIWSAGGGIAAIPLPTGTSQGSARAVNDAGWVVGTASSAFAIPFLYDGTATYSLQSLLVGATGWDLSTNTSSSALAITNDGSIIGTAVHNGQTHGYLMQLAPVPEPQSWALMAAGLALTAALARRRG